MPSLPRPRVPRSLLFGTIALAVLLVVLATLQYRWLGQISEADEARLRAGARSRAEQLARDFDREVTRAFLWLHVDAGSVRSHDWAEYADRRARWARLTAHAGFVKDVWLVDPAGQAPQRFDPAASSFQPAPWPDSLVSLRERVHDIALAFSSPPHFAAAHASPRPGPSGASRSPKPFHRPSDLFDDQIPAFVAPIPSFEPSAPGRVGVSFSRLAGFTIVTLDLDYMRRRFFPALVERHFGADEDSDYAVVVSRRSDPRAVLFRSAPPVPGATSEGDATATLLGVRLDDVTEEDMAALPPPSPAPSSRVSGRRLETHRFGWTRRPGELDAGRWRVVVTHRAGSVDQVVAAARRRNLGIGAGILALLTVSVVLIVVSSQRARRLADRQLEFVAGVSHELRTPVAVICSAGENLADGLVKEPALVQQYGQVVRDEGRRLVEMVEQVLDFAGSYSGRRAYRFEELGVSELVRECLEAVSRGETGLQVEATLDPGLPPVRADRDALRRAVQNLLQNAVKYGGQGGWIGVQVAAGPGPPGERAEVCITVQDHGLGIPPSEVERLFEPFFRGEEAQSRQIRGSGLGLSLVKRIVEAHGGRVGVKSAPGRGSAFTIALPASPPLRPGAAPAGAEMAPPHPVPVSEPPDGTPHTAR